MQSMQSSRVLQLIVQNFGPGDKLVRTQTSSPDIAAQASITSSGREILRINTSNHTVTVHLASPILQASIVDEDSGEQTPAPSTQQELTSP
jgi:hypothetical protein